MIHMIRPLAIVVLLQMSVSATAFQAEAEHADAYYYEYWYPAGGVWRHDNLGTPGQGRAFCRSDMVVC